MLQLVVQVKFSITARAAQSSKSQLLLINFLLIAGALASAFTTPLDVVKTLLNTQETGVGVTSGMKEAIIQVNY